MITRTHHVWIVAGIMALVGAHGAQGGDRIRWRFEIPSNASGEFIGVGADGRVYTTSFIPQDLYALSPDGSLLWTAAGAGGGNPITFAADGTIYTGEVSVFAVNPDGTVRWEFTPPYTGYTLRLLAGPNVGPDGNIYAAENVINGLGLGFFSLDANGNLRWSNQGDPNVSGLTDGDDVVFGDGRLFGGIHFLRSGPWLTSYAFDLGGSQLWFGGFLPRYFEPTSAPRMLLDGRIAYRAGAGSLAAVNQDGFANWIVPHPDGAQQLVTPVVGPDGSIYAGDAFGVQLWSTDPDGTTRWVLGQELYDSLASLGVSPDNRVLVVGGSSYYDGGWIRGYDAGNGDLLWRVDLPFEQGLTQLTRTVRPAFSPNGDTAYLTTWFAGDGVGHCYLYAIATADAPTVLLRSTGIALSATLLRKGQVSVTGVVTVEDEDNTPASGATIFATWTLPNGAVRNRTAGTDIAGHATFDIKSGRGTYTLTITNITKPGYTFDLANSVLSQSITR